MNRLLFALLLAAGLSPALAQSATTTTRASDLQLVQATAPLAEGEVRRINKEQAKITLRHGEIKSLDMPPMTMVFNVSDATVLDQFKVGDKVRFVAEKRNELFFVTRIEPAK